MIRMRTYPAVDNHCSAVPTADTLSTEAWLDVSKEPWVLSIPEMGNRYYIVPMLDGRADPCAEGDTTLDPGWELGTAARQPRPIAQAKRITWHWNPLAG